MSVSVCIDTIDPPHITPILHVLHPVFDRTYRVPVRAWTRHFAYVRTPDGQTWSAARPADPHHWNQFVNRQYSPLITGLTATAFTLNLRDGPLEFVNARVSDAAMERILDCLIGNNRPVSARFKDH